MIIWKLKTYLLHIENKFQGKMLLNCWKYSKSPFMCDLQILIILTKNYNLSKKFSKLSYVNISDSFLFYLNPRWKKNFDTYPTWFCQVTLIKMHFYLGCQWQSVVVWIWHETSPFKKIRNEALTKIWRVMIMTALSD